MQQINVTFTGANIGAIVSQAKAFIGAAGAEPQVVTTKTATRTATPAKKAKQVEEEEEETFGDDDNTDEEEIEAAADSEEEEEDTDASEEDEDEPAPAKKTKSGKPTLSDVMAAFRKHAAAKNRASALSALKKFKVESVHDLDESQYAKAMAALGFAWGAK